eukprot:358937-Chlamydomonas_euryale.AAC.14
MVCSRAQHRLKWHSKVAVETQMLEFCLGYSTMIGFGGPGLGGSGMGGSGLGGGGYDGWCGGG